MTDLKILQNQIAYDYSADDIELLSETTVGQIIKGKEILVSMPRLPSKSLLITKHQKNCFSQAKTLNYN